MTLFKQIVIIIAFFQTIMFGVIMWQNFNTANEFVQTQLGIDARHTANSLGLSITPAATNNDLVLIETMISSMYDSGYYELISLVDTAGKTLIKKYQKPQISDIPNWFISFVKMNAPTASSRIMAGWNQFGKLYVKNNIGVAYGQLWTTFKEIATSFILITMLAFLVLYISLKIVLIPLKKVQEQAEAISQNDFLLQQNLPFTKELKKVVIAMNSMIKKVKIVFEKEADTVKKYHELLYRDDKTALFNRRYFTLNLKEWLKSEDNSTGSIVFTSIANQNVLKEDVGYEKKKELFKMIGKVALEFEEKYKNVIFARMQGSDFAILFPNKTPNQTKVICADLVKKFNDILDTLKLDKSRYFFNFGIVNYSNDMKMSDILSKADFALTSAKAKGAFEVSVHEDWDDFILGKEAWRDEIESAIRERRFMFATQKSINTDNETYHHELFLRLKDGRGKIKNASYFMPMINELHLFDKIDRYVLDEATHLLENRVNAPISINIGKDIMLNTSSLAWFEKSLAKLSQVCKCKISFETVVNSEISIGIMGSFSKMLRKQGFDFGLDNFALDGDSLKILQDINPSYIKIQNSIILDLLEGESGDMTKQSLKLITESMDIKIIASGIENEDEKRRLEDLGIKYLQGSLIQKPKLLDENWSNK